MFLFESNYKFRVNELFLSLQVVANIIDISKTLLTFNNEFCLWQIFLTSSVS